ncbi:DUF4269 domain-containing protein [Chryseobacterium sp. SIMBA_029]|uniref:DUF4269 domain-containing protein n=1 Tax=Chryseobacterium sp. SIMBA_029 TaxID=3085772 RepID=UPI00397AF31A
MIDFTTIAYLKNGNKRQQYAFEILKKYEIFEKLNAYFPVLAGTIPIEIDIEGSDLDIICEVDLQFQEVFIETVKNCIPDHTEVHIENMAVNGEQCIVINYKLKGFLIEIFGQNKPPLQQNAYRHMISEHKILQEKGENFKQKIIELKKEGMKTEPAFGLLLGLENPYEELLKF